MVISGVQTTVKNIPKLKKLGVKDSKLLLPQKRFDLVPEILKLCDVKACFITAEEISAGRNLNELECENYCEICKHFPNARLYIIDNYEHDREAFIARAESVGFKPGTWKEYVIQHHADENYTIVGAASVISKTMSELEMSSLRRKYKFGSGQPNDKRTIRFLKNHLHKDCNRGCEQIRKTWISYKRLLGD